MFVINSKRTDVPKSHYCAHMLHFWTCHFLKSGGSINITEAVEWGQHKKGEEGISEFEWKGRGSLTKLLRYNNTTVHGAHCAYNRNTQMCCFSLKIGCWRATHWSSPPPLLQHYPSVSCFMCWVAEKNPSTLRCRQSADNVSPSC